MDVRTAQTDTRLSVIIVAGLLLIAGLALFGLRRVARRI
jgi:MprA protease rhombosortase-interaction domain-containing protein